MALLSRLRLVTVDVTGTLIAYRGLLGDYYCTAAMSAGLPCPGYARMHQAFKAAYADMTTKHPCFGHASRMPDDLWWKMCVRDSFLRGSEWDFGVFSGVAGVEKPDRRIYEMALEAAGGVAPEEALHIGDSMSKDYAPARAVGMHALLLDRFGTADAERWRRSGAVVLPDLVSAREWLTRGPPVVHGRTNNAWAED